MERMSKTSPVLTSLDTCPECGRAIEGRPFCPADGTITAAGPLVVGDGYLVDERIGARGGLLVFAARDAAVLPVTLKVLRPDLAADARDADRFLDRARAAAGLRHPNIGSLLDFGYDFAPDLSLTVGERICGRLLGDVMVQAGPMPWERAAHILLQIARALSCAHIEGVLHRALHPRNILILEEEHDFVKLNDFGVTRANTRAYLAP